MRKATKTITSFAVVLIAGLNLIVPALAQDPFTAIGVGGLTGASGAGLFSSMAGMSGLNISWSNNDPVSIDAMWDVTNPDYILFHGEKHEATNIGEDVYDYIQVDIGDWLKAQSDFISNLIDNNNIADNSTGNIEGDLTAILGLSATLSNNTYYTDPIDIPATVGDYAYGETTIRVIQDGNYKNFSLIYGQTTILLWRGQAGGRVRFTQQTDNRNINVQYTQDTNWHTSGTIDSGYFPVNTDFDVDWQSGTINKNVFNGWESARVKIPSSVSQLQPGWTPVDFFNELDRIWYGADEDSIIIEDGNDDPPVPPGPVPTTPLGNVPFDDWVDLWGQGIYEQLENQSDALDLIGSNGIDAIEELESIDTNTEDLVEVAESIDTNIGVGNGILGGIRSLAQSAVNYLEGIAEHVSELVEEIVEGTETLIAGILNQIPQVFSVIFGPIKQASSIWHYVVEWIQSIGAPFQFIWSMASGTSYYIILPVYASLAAAVVLAFYKRFGK